MDVSYTNRRIIVSNAAKNSEKKSFTAMKLKTRMADQVGIYAIICEDAKCVYIGQSKNIPGRIKNHKSYLRQGKHVVLRMQLDYKIHGVSAFVFEKIYECEEAHLLHWETAFIKEYLTKGYDVYNTVLETYGYHLLQVSQEYKTLMEKIIRALEKGKISKKELEDGIESLLNRW